MNLFKSENLCQFGLCLLLLFSCRQNRNTQETFKSGVVKFNNDSAMMALQTEYFRELKNDKKGIIDTSFGVQVVDFCDVYPIITENCVPCHQTTGNAPFPLTNYHEILKRSAMIREVMLQRIMPPFMGDPSYSSLVNAPRMNDSIRWRIVNWIDQGALKSQEGCDYESIDKRQSDIRNGNTLIYSAQEHTINSNEDSYQCFVIDLGLKTDTFVKAMKFHSTNPGTIHHIMVYMDTLGILESFPSCWNCMKNEVVNQLIPIDAWSKGMTPCKLSSNFAYKYRKGAKLLLQIHYGDEGNKGQKEKTSFQLLLGNKPKREVKWEILNNLEIFFPANTVKTETISFQTDSAISLVGGGPHMHFLAKKVEIFAITSDFKKIHILKIHKWDYLWQGNYYFNKLVVIPAGSTIYMNVVYDNTENNPDQPNEPIRDVKYDTFSDEEMMVLSLIFVDYKKGDEKLTPIEILR